MRAPALFFFAFLVLFLLAAQPAAAGQMVPYYDGETVLEGYWAPAQCPEGQQEGEHPAVLIIHQWMGLGDYEKMRADMLAARCYNAFAVDMYGQGQRPQNREEASGFSGLFKDDPALARRRINAALDFVRNIKGVDSARTAALGYCFGGTMALELARSGADVNGVISFHGGLSTRAPAEPDTVRAAIQIHHGAADRFVPQEDVINFMMEMDMAGVDWALTQYAGAVHAFTEKDAGDDPSSGVAYNEKADIRSWAAALAFLDELFAPGPAAPDNALDKEDVNTP